MFDYQILLIISLLLLFMRSMGSGELGVPSQSLVIVIGIWGWHSLIPWEGLVTYSWWRIVTTHAIGLLPQLRELWSYFGILNWVVVLLVIVVTSRLIIIGETVMFLIGYCHMVSGLITTKVNWNHSIHVWFQCIFLCRLRLRVHKVLVRFQLTYKSQQGLVGLTLRHACSVLLNLHLFQKVELFSTETSIGVLDACKAGSKICTRPAW